MEDKEGRSGRIEILYVEGISVPAGTHEGKKIVIGSDHRGFEYKKSILKFLVEKSYTVKDVGTFSRERCDYPLYSGRIGAEVSRDRELNTVGIGICGSGIGILIPASKYEGVYPARCLTPEDACTSRRHNNTNLLGIGADIISLELALALVKSWLETPFFSDRETEISYLHRSVQTARLEKEIKLRPNYFP